MALTLAGAPALAAAAETGQVESLLARLAAQQTELERQQSELARQQSELERQRTELTQQRREIEELRVTLLPGAVAPAALSPSGGAPATGPQAATTTAQARMAAGPDKELGLEISGYGIVNYYNRDWETDEFAKDAFDTERFILELEYRFSDQFFAAAELEFEHGGTGVTLEFDSQEEFGEFETEVEKGGEVIVEELYVAYQHANWLNGRVGRFVVPVGRTNKYHDPQDYFTVARSEADAAVIPQLWHEAGVSAYGSQPLGRWGRLDYETQVVTALDSSGFSSRNWIAGGHQKRFDEARAEDLAFVARVDYHPWSTLQLGGAYYGGNSKGNRPKNDLAYDAFVDILEFDGAWTTGDFILRGQYLWGRLQNSHLVTEANRTLSNNLGVKRTPVGSEAQSWFVEAGYDLLPSNAQELVVFGRYDEYDSMYRTEGLVFDNPRWSRGSWTIGLNYRPLPDIVFKAEYNARTLDLDENDEENTFALGVGFTY
jgi:hypothetical protein